MGAISNYRGGVPLPYSPTYTKHYPVEYFSSCDVSLFIDDQYIDEVTCFEFTLTESVVPVYSYASYTPKKIVHGSRLVRGSFSINMRPGDYLHEMLRADVRAAEATNSLPALGATVSSITATSPMPDPAVDPDGFHQWAAIQKSIHWDQVEAMVNTQKDITQSQPYFVNGGFTILLVYGDFDSIDLTRNNGKVRTIENVHIFSGNQGINLGGENIQETFSFIAGDINQTTRTQGF